MPLQREERENAPDVRIHARDARQYKAQRYLGQVIALKERDGFGIVSLVVDAQSHHQDVVTALNLVR